MGETDISTHTYTSSKNSFQTSHSSCQTAASLILALLLQHRIEGLHSSESTSFSLSIYLLQTYVHPYPPTAHHDDRSIINILSPSHLPGKSSLLPITNSPLLPEKQNQCLFVHIRKPEFRIKRFAQGTHS